MRHISPLLTGSLKSPAFAKKLILTRRIRWFADSNGSPSFNHAWFLWDHRQSGAPTIAYDVQGPVRQGRREKVKARKGGDE
jgi:hypothetical protein